MTRERERERERERAGGKVRERQRNWRHSRVADVRAVRVLVPVEDQVTSTFNVSNWYSIAKQPAPVPHMAYVLYVVSVEHLQQREQRALPWTLSDCTIRAPVDCRAKRGPASPIADSGPIIR